jgi:hypothetical protein
MERRDSGGAEKPSEVLGACSRERRARQDSRRGLFALRSVESKEIAARRRHQLPARKEVRNGLSFSSQLSRTHARGFLPTSQ